MDAEQVESTAELTAENIGGIDRTEVEFEPGITVLAGRNATNRTSLLQAIMAAVGSDGASLKADAEEGTVELQIDGETYTRTLERHDNRVETRGGPYVDDPTLADLFAFLLESNEVRRSAVTDADLRDLIMRPVDTAEIQAEIERLVDERRAVDDELEELEKLKRRLPSLEEERTELQAEIEDTKAELAEIESAIDAQDVDVERSREEQAEVETKLKELREVRSELEEVRYDLETEQESLESVRAKKRNVDEAYEELPDDPTDDIDALEQRIDQLRSQKQQLEAELNEIQNVIGFNEERLEDGSSPVTDVFEGESENAVTDELLPQETVTCWTCGTDVETEQIETTVEKLQKSSKRLVGDINDIEAELEEVTERRQTLQEQRREHERLERRRDELDAELEKTEARIEELSNRRDDLREEVERMESEIEAQENDSYEEILDLHKEANQLEYDLGRLENELERVQGNIETIGERLDEESALKTRREEISAEIEALRGRIDNIEQDIVEIFNDHMDNILELLNYDNIERIWLERRKTEVRDGRRKTTKTVFDFHIARKTSSGTTYEDTVENLSESEREVTGLLLALSGYLAHEVYETVPFMLLDSLEAIDAARIATLVEYFDDFGEFLVIALLPEDAATLDDYRQITDI
jgi:peptidoglycan hydrolase CwlO-like protein